MKHTHDTDHTTLVDGRPAKSYDLVLACTTVTL